MKYDEGARSAPETPLWLVTRRVFLAVALFIGPVLIPAALNLVTPGHPVLVLSHYPYLAVTDSGLYGAGLLLFRAGISIAFAALLTFTTRWNDLLRGLRVLFVPRIFLLVAAMTYRYMVVMMQAVCEMFVARTSRTIGHSTRRENKRFVGGAIGALFGKTVALTDEVHSAMISRGWTGEPRALEPQHLRAADALWLAAMIALAAIALGGEFIG